MKPDLNQFYGNYDENGRLLTRAGHVEFVTTMHFIEKYLTPGARILEVGAATGRYSHTLARMGYRVDAMELVEHNIEIFNELTQPGEDVTIRQGNAVDLSAFDDNTFDLTLILGPMYHLFEEADRRRALREAVRVTKQGGVIFAAYCMIDASVLCYGFARGELQSLIRDNRIDLTDFTQIPHELDFFHLCRREEIDALRSGLGVTQLHFVAAEGYAKHMEHTLADMDEETYKHFLRYHLHTCERQDMVGISHHTIDIFRKD
ncbi:MAG: class I SAM-dependent methyltransferase [Oscillospiraceae bacterium]|nr:class I SAM-dependent methyltransferase [Oscillospiraceae bacterium]